MKKHKNNKRLSLAVAFVLGCLTSLPVFAEEASTKAELAFDLEGITVEAARPDWESKLSPGSVTVIRPDDYKGEQKTLPDLMRKVPGVHVREVNGKGQYTTVTVRGSTAAQVGVFIDGVLSNLGGDATADLSTIPVSNVERIEIYRGYIPARFAGTYIGGVINIVTKKPEKADVNVELGKSSYGGKKGALEIVAPLGDGSLMVGANYESSDGDFKYENYAAKYDVIKLSGDIAAYQKEIAEFNNNNILAYKYLLSDDKLVDFQADNNLWVEFLEDDTNGFKSKYIETLREQVANKTYDPGKDVFRQAGLNGKKDFYTASDSKKEEVYKLDAQNKIAQIHPEDNETIAGYEKSLAEADKKLQSAKNPTRWRQYNDYENINSIIKWQNEDWMVKAAWNKTDRHLPDGLYNGGIAAAAILGHLVDTENSSLLYPYDSRRQKIDNKELLLQNRKNVGKLEWGWMVDYVRSAKEYRAEEISGRRDDLAPLTEWSKYDSNKYSGQVDGTYKLSNNNMLDFQVNYSFEKMDVDGNNVNKELATGATGLSESNPYEQLRNRYEQELLNIQLQDTITLDEKATWHFTPSVRYNQSKITGYSDESRLGGKWFNWVSPEDEQTDSKTTWQLALKKKFDDNFTMRMTGGTYYRLLNMYEIAGDGASIVPAPVDFEKSKAKFPSPEEGKQFDISALWNGNALGAYNKTSLTYFWRDSDNMLQLQRYGKHFWCYLNDNRGTANGIELQSSFNWSKFDLDLQATYTNSKMQKQNSSGVVQNDYVDAYATYQPKWEGNVRLTYRPHETIDFFTEAHYTDAYYTSSNKELGELTGRPVKELLIFNSGIKYTPNKNLQITLGCNDLFNEGPKQNVLIHTLTDGVIYVNPEYPHQGRTYYITAKYNF